MATIESYDNFTVTLANRKTPWESGLSWAEGQKPGAYTSYVSAAEMLDAAGMANWNITKTQLTLPNGKPVPGAFANVARPGTDEERILGVVGNAYQPRQPEQIFAFGDNIVDSGEAKWERAGGFNGGSLIFACMELTHLGISVPGDESDLKPYLFLMDTFDGSYPTTGLLAFVRPVCINTFEMALGTNTAHRFTIRHVGGLEGKLEMARNALGVAFKHTAETAEIVQRLAVTKMVDQQVAEILSSKVWPIADGAADDAVDNHVSTKVFELYQTSETLDSIRGTAWGALNAVTEYVDHYVKYNGRGISSADDVRGKSLLLGAGESRKEVALKALMEFAK